MEKDDLKYLFTNLKDSLDTEEPIVGHQERFLEKLNNTTSKTKNKSRKLMLWKPLAIAATLLLFCSLGVTYFKNSPTTAEQLAEISPEASQTQFYFANLINEQVKELEKQSSPATQQLISDTMLQLNKLEDSYTNLEQVLLNGGDSKIILSAMITNFQTRIDLIKEVLNKIETIKSLKNQTNENYTI